MASAPRAAAACCSCRLPHAAAVQLRALRRQPPPILPPANAEVLCNPSDPTWIPDARDGVALIRKLDPSGQRPVSANQNGYVATTHPMPSVPFSPLFGFLYPPPSAFLPRTSTGQVDWE